jgi:hypothetical protein
LREVGPAVAEALLPRVYDDVPQHMHGMAMRSLRAHLFKLRDEARVAELGDQWSLRS